MLAFFSTKIFNCSTQSLQIYAGKQFGIKKETTPRFEMSPLLMKGVDLCTQT